MSTAARLCVLRLCVVKMLLFDFDCLVRPADWRDGAASLEIKEESWVVKASVVEEEISFALFDLGRATP